jgi:uncharacterized repeat protein (TIGR03803 family)
MNPAVKMVRALSVGAALGLLATRSVEGQTVSTLYSFPAVRGRNPEAALVQGRDGNFYGTTDNGGGRFDGGTVFMIAPSGTVTALYCFASDGIAGQR